MTATLTRFRALVAVSVALLLVVGLVGLVHGRRPDHHIAVTAAAPDSGDDAFVPTTEIPVETTTTSTTIAPTSTTAGLREAVTTTTRAPAGIAPDTSPHPTTHVDHMAPNTDCEWNYILWKGSGALTIQAHNSSFHDGDSAMMLLTWSAPATGPDRANARVMGDMAVAVITVTPQMQGGSVHVLARDTEALANGTYTAGTTFPQCASTIPVDYDDPAHAS